MHSDDKEERNKGPVPLKSLTEEESIVFVGNAIVITQMNYSLTPTVLHLQYNVTSNLQNLDILSSYIIYVNMCKSHHFVS